MIFSEKPPGTFPDHARGGGMGRDSKGHGRMPARRRKASTSRRKPVKARRGASTRSKDRADRLARELKEALQQQAATAAVLQVINSSPGELAPVFDVMLDKATRLCGAGFGCLWIYEGEQFRAAAVHALPAALAEFTRQAVPVTTAASLLKIVRGQNTVHVRDLAATELYRTGNPTRRAFGQRPARRLQHLPPGGAAVFRQADRAGADLRRPGGDRH
jgi:hypothetical protein